MILFINSHSSKIICTDKRLHFKTRLSWKKTINILILSWRRPPLRKKYSTSLVLHPTFQCHTKNFSVYTQPFSVYTEVLRTYTQRFSVYTQFFRVYTEVLGVYTQLFNVYPEVLGAYTQLFQYTHISLSKTWHNYSMTNLSSDGAVRFLK